MNEAGRDELVRRLFVLMTAKLEDGATMAVDGQGAERVKSAHLQIAQQLRSVGDEVSILAEAAVFLCSGVALIE
jgi:hypothetical protein